MAINLQKIRVASLLLLEIITVTVPVIVLGDVFHFPDILRQPASEGLVLFRQNQASIVPAYYVFMLSGLLYIPLSYALRQSLPDARNQNGLRLLVGLGLVTAIFQAIGFSRWLFVVPYLAEQYVQYPQQHEQIALLYEVLNRYAGMTIGEHLGFLAMGSWQLALSWVLLKQLGWVRWLGGIGMLIGILLIMSVVEHFGGPNAALFGSLNFAANAIWTFWLLAVGVYVVRR